MSTTSDTGTIATESVESFRERARHWLEQTLPPAPPIHSGEQKSPEVWARARQLQRILYDAGFAGICFPAEYGGLGLTPAHQRAFTEESRPYEMPLALNIPTLTICAATLLDLGNEDQKRTHIRAALRGEELLVQFLSEPRGGSDLAGLTTRAERRDDGWVLELQDLEFGRLRRRLRPVPGPHRLDGAQTSRADHVPGPGTLPPPDDPAHHPGRRLHRVLPGILRQRLHTRRRRGRRGRRRLGGRRPPAAARTQCGRRRITLCQRSPAACRAMCAR